MKDPIVGIDLGTSNSVVAQADGGGAVSVLADEGGYKIHPSVVAFHPNGGVVVGAGAKQRKVIDPSNTIYSVKRMIGRAFDSPEVTTLRSRVPFQIKCGQQRLPMIVTRGGEFAPPEISAIVLDHMRNIAVTRLGTRVERAVVTVPAAFNDAQRSATATAGAIAGITVVRVINEPTAAALAYGNTRNLKETIAVYDFGGGTFDITILRLNDQVYEVLGTAGDTFLGGDDLDERLVDKMVNKFLAENRVDLRHNEVAMMRLRAVAEQTKIELSRRSRAVVRIDEIAYGAKGKPLDLHIEISRDEFVAQVADIIDRTFPVCQESLSVAGIGIDKIDDVILVGGTTKIPYVRDQVSQFFGRAPRTDVNPEDAVAVGAALQAASLEQILSRPRTSASMASQSFDSLESFADGEPLPSGYDDNEVTTAQPPPTRPEPASDPALRTDTAYSIKRGASSDHLTDDPYDTRTPTAATPLARITRPAAPPSKRTQYGVPAAPRPGAVRTVTAEDDLETRPKLEAPRPSDFSTEMDTGVAMDLADQLAAEARASGADSEFRAELDTGSAMDLADQLAAEALQSPASTAKGMGPAKAPTRTAPAVPPPHPPPHPPPMPPAAPPPAPPAPPSPSGVSFSPPTPPASPQVPKAPPAAPTISFGPGSTASPSAPTLAALVPSAIDPRTPSGPGAAPAPMHALPTILEVAPRGLGIATVAGFCEELIRRNSRLPATMRKSFTTARDSQAMVRIVICQGESRRLDNNTVIGDLVLANLPPRARGETTIDVTFVIDASGTLQVSARDAATGTEQRASLDLVGGLPQQEVAASRERLQQLRR